MGRLTGILATAILFCCLGDGQGRRTQVRGHVHPALRTATDMGKVGDEQQLPSLSISFQIPAEKRTQLEALLNNQQDPASPDYHKWLTPEEYAARFGAADTDIAAVRSWLESQGLPVKSVSRGRDRISFSGSVRRVEAAFETEIHKYSMDGVMHIANAAEPTVTAALAGKIAAIHGLNDFRMRPPRPRYTSVTGGNHYLAPDDFATIYNVRPLYDKGITGTGQKVAVVGQTQVNLPDLQLFRSSFNLPASDPQMLLVPGTEDPGISRSDVGEALLDLDWVGAVARNATLLYVYSFDVTDAAFYVIDQNLAPVISMSYGLCEQLIGTADMNLHRTYAQRAAAQGITWVAASGDAGAADCYSGTSRDVSPLAVDAPASIPEVTGIGGTTFNEGSGTYWNTANDANRASAQSYIPEVAWNDVSSGSSLSASGGGASAFFPKPSWQTGSGVPNDNARDVPDIALSASASHVGYLLYQNGNLQVFGGTSAGAPAFAGIVALMNQYQVSNGLQASPGMGNVNPRLYAMAAGVPNAFHDVTSGSNMVNPCSSRVLNCTSGNIGFTAGPGYDQVTGLGSVDAFSLVTGWGAPAPKTPVQITLTSSVTSLPLSGSAVLTASVASANGSTPSGTVSFFAGGTQLGTALLSGSSGTATATLTVQAAQLSVGSASFTAAYSGDGTFSSATSPAVAVTITAATSIVISGAVNAASYKAGAAPGMILAVFGSLLAGSTQSAPVVPLPTTLGGVSATINGIAAPLYFVSQGQINLQVPYLTSSGSATVRVTYNGQTATSSFIVSSAAPGVFFDPRTNGSPVPDQTAKRSQTVSLYITGEGVATPALISGSLPPAGITARPVQPVSVSVGGIPAALAYVGIPSWAIGATQINYTVPANAPLGATPVVVTVGGIASPPVTLTITQ